MALLTASLMTDLLLLFFTLFGLFYIYIQNIYRYWEKRGVPYIKPKFLFGAMKEVMFQKKSFSKMIAESYLQTSKTKYIGFFSFYSPALIINDFDIMKHIMIKDFNYFSDRGVYSNKKKDPLSANVIATAGQEWKDLRKKLSPSFTISKLKTMFDIAMKCREQFQSYVASESARGEAIEWKDVFNRYGFEVVAKGGFGLETNSFDKCCSKIYDMIRQLFAPSLIQVLWMTITFYSANLARLLNMRVYPKHIADFYMDIFRDTVLYRESNNIFRNDLMQLLMELRRDGTSLNADEMSQKKSKEFDSPLTMHDIAAQGLLFSLTAFETPSSALIFCVYELAMNPDIQQKLQEEIDRLEGEITYEKLNGMEYLDMVISETFRKYPPIAVSKRVCTQDYKVPGSDLVIEKGTSIVIPIYGMHMNPELFPEPEKFIPERFSKENMKPFSYLPFGQGPRICIGMKFGPLIMKTAIVQLLQKFNLEITTKTRIPIVFEPKGILTNAAGGMWLKAVKRSI